MSLAERKEREKEQRHKDIVDAAQRLFFANKYDDVSMDDIAREVELSKATLYLYFKNKESLYFAVLLLGLYILRDRFAEAAGDNQRGLDKISALCRAFFKYCQDYPEYYQLMCDARSRRFDMNQVESAEEQIAVAEEIIGNICHSVSEGVTDGTLRKELKPIETAVFIMDTCEGIVRPALESAWYLESRKVTLEQYFAHSMGLLIYSISGANTVQKAGAGGIR